MYVLLTSSLVVSIGLLFQGELVSRIPALIDLADDMERRNRGIKPLSDLESGQKPAAELGVLCPMPDVLWQSHCQWNKFTDYE